MGTVCSFTLTGDENTAWEDLYKAADKVQETFYAIEKSCNIFDEKSELSKLNSAMKNAPVKCSEMLWQILLKARFFHQYSSGAFDVTIQPLMRLWGFYRKKQVLPSAEEIRKVKKNTGLEKVIFDVKKQTVFAGGSGRAFDLGGIAKGYALDKAAECAASLGIRRGLLDLGGNLRSLELPPGKNKEAHIIGIRDPNGGQNCIETVKMPNNMSIATSGNYERYVVIDNIRYTHILDGRTGRPVSGMLSVTVLTPEGVDSDALSTSIFILGEKFAEKVCKDFPRTSVLLFREENGKIVRKSFGRAFRKEP